jgi:segregation and condensation protein A
LFACVRDRKVDLLDVPLLPVCEAYFLYLLADADHNLDQAAAALAALAYLLERKAWALLPVPEAEPEADGNLELCAPTTHEYEAAIKVLGLWQEEREQLFFRPAGAGPDPYELPYELANVSVTDLARAFERLLTKVDPEPVRMLNKPRRSISEQMKLVLRALKTEWSLLEELVPTPFTREEAVYWFLALLELIRIGQASVRLFNEDVQFARAA